LEQEHTYPLDDVLRHGFEARCLDADGARYLWHGTCGLRVDPGTDKTVLMADPADLPEGPWVATAWGKEEIEEDLQTLS
jgi:hypothetical protein